LGIQVPKGIKNAIDLDKKNGSKKAIKTEQKQIKDCQTFVIFDSWGSIPHGFQKIPYHIVFDVNMT
jgi:hypothetical protein